MAFSIDFMLDYSDEMKICSKCFNILPKTTDFFAIRGKEKKFTRGQCRTCYRDITRITLKKWQDEHREEENRKKRLYNNTIEGKRRIKESNNKNKLYASNIYLINKYGISLEEKNKYWIEQNKKCYISNLPLKNLSEAHVDHYEIGGKIVVRKLLNGNINRGLGKFDDNILWMNNSITYLQNVEHQNKINYIIKSNKYRYNTSDSLWTEYENYHNSFLKSKYRISLWDYYDILKLQNNRCIISLVCHTNEDRLVVDHCHKTNQIRGLINLNINHGLGMFKDNIEWLKNGENYLKKLGGKNSI